MSRIEQIEKLIAKDPADPFLYFSLGMEYQGAGRGPDAIEQFDRVINLDSKYLAAYVQKAQVLVKAKRLDDAQQVLTKAAAVARDIGDQHMLDNINEMLEML